MTVKSEHKHKLREYYENEAKSISHQERMYHLAEKHELWWHRKRLSYVFFYLSEIFRKSTVKTFVDVGCAEGFYVKYVANRYPQTLCVGVDLAIAYLRKAKVSVRNMNVDFVACDVERLPFRHDVMDIVLCSEVLEHVYDYRASISELNRVAKRFLVLSFPGHTYLYHVISSIGFMKRFADGLVQDVGHVSEIHISDVKELLKWDYMSFNIKIGASFPILVFKIIPSIGLVEAIDNITCNIMKSFGASDYANIHVIEIMKNE